MPRLDLQKIQRVLVIKLRHHGDVLLTSPVFTALRAAAPHIEVDALIYADTAPMLSGHPDITELITIPRKTKGFLNKLRTEFSLIKQLRKRQYDLVINLCMHNRSILTKLYSQPRYTVSPIRPEKYLWNKVFDFYYGREGTPKRPIVETNLDSLRHIGIKIEKAHKQLFIEIPDKEESSAKQRLQEQGIHGRYLVIHPGSRWFFKCWTKSGYQTLIQHIQQQGIDIVLTGAPDPIESQFIADILQDCPASHTQKIVNLCGQISLKELAAVIKQATLFIGSDSAPMHIAAATGTPVLAFFGPSSDAEWGPWLVPHRVLTTQHSCRPCLRAGCGDSQISECLTEIPADQAIAAFDDLFAECA